MRVTKTEPQLLERVGMYEQLMLTVSRGELRVERPSPNAGRANGDCIAAMGKTVQLKALRDRLTALLVERGEE